MTNLRALDLFCGPGGASKGLFDAGFEVTGVDRQYQPDYPYDFVQCDVFDLPMEFFKDFDLIWASPPCQGYCDANINKECYTRLIPLVRELLKQTKKPYVIENVQLAPIRHDLMLCGDMFHLKVIRHRYFEIEGFHVPRIKHFKHKGLMATGDYVACYNGGNGNERTRKKYGRIKFSFDQQKEALGVDWVTPKSKITECIPPKYSEYIAYKLYNSVNQND